MQYCEPAGLPSLGDSHMHLDSQLKRGYLALIGLMVLGLALIAAPGVPENQTLSVSSELVAKTCKVHIRSTWKLASTPIDIEPLLIRKALICGA